MTTPVAIPVKAIEAAARESGISTYEARAALTAALPFIAAHAKAEALREAAADLNSQLREYRLGAHEVLTQKIKPSGGDDTRSLQLALVAAKHTESWLRARAASIEGKSE